MTLTIELPDNLEAALKAQAHAHGTSEAAYVRSMLERDLADTSHVSSAALEVGTSRKNLAHFLLESPFAGSDLNLERQQDYGRPVDL